MKYSYPSSPNISYVESHCDPRRFSISLRHDDDNGEIDLYDFSYQWIIEPSITIEGITLYKIRNLLTSSVLSISPTLGPTGSGRGILGEIFLEAPIQAHHLETSTINICPDLTQYWIFEPLEPKRQQDTTTRNPIEINEFALLEEKVATHEITKEEAIIQAKIQTITSCPNHFLFVRVEEEKLYRCTGGAHSHSFAELGLTSDEDESEMEVSEKLKALYDDGGIMEENK